MTSAVLLYPSPKSRLSISVELVHKPGYGFVLEMRYTKTKIHRYTEYFMFVQFNPKRSWVIQQNKLSIKLTLIFLVDIKIVIMKIYL